MMVIRAGVVPMMLAGGADAPIAAGILQAFEKMRVISTRRSTARVKRLRRR
jgi:3-oxoacyl-(acyl-carrier-protein) synthase